MEVSTDKETVVISRKKGNAVEWAHQDLLGLYLIEVLGFNFTTIIFKTVTTDLKNCALSCSQSFFR